MQYGIFNDDAADYTEDEAIEAGFYSKEEAEVALRDRYTDEDELHVHAVMEADEEDDDDLEEDEDDSESYPVKY